MPRIPLDGFLESGSEAAGSKRRPGLGNVRRIDVETAVRRLPPLPAVLAELMRELRDLNADMKKLEARISSDASLTTRVLRMANSPFYGCKYEILSVSRAVVTLGFKTVSNLVLAAGFRASMTGHGHIPGHTANGIFRHSLAAGVCTARLARLPKLREFGDSLFVAGLLHDVGRVALSSYYGRYSSDFEQRARELEHAASAGEQQAGSEQQGSAGQQASTDQQVSVAQQANSAERQATDAAPDASDAEEDVNDVEPLREDRLSIDAEQSIFGTDHQQVGTKVVEHWKLPAELVGPVSRHHEPVDNLLEDPVTLAVVVVDLWLNARGVGLHEPRNDAERREQAIRALVTTPERVDELLDDFEAEVDTILSST